MENQDHNTLMELLAEFEEAGLFDLDDNNEYITDEDYPEVTQ